MGGFGAMSYAARHPDRFAAAASFSGAVDTNNAGIASVVGEAAYGPRRTQEVRWRAHNPWDLAPNLRSLKLVLRTGNGRPGGPFSGGDADGIEQVVHSASSSLHDRLRLLRIGHVWEDHGPGEHTWPYWRRDLRRTLPQLMHSFARPPARPAAVTHRAVEPAYEVFGWRVRLQRPALEFSELRDATRNGFTVRGSGTATVTTPRHYRPGARVRVRRALGRAGAPASDRRGRSLGEAARARRARAGEPPPAVRAGRRHACVPGGGHAAPRALTPSPCIARWGPRVPAVWPTCASCGSAATCASATCPRSPRPPQGERTVPLFVFDDRLLTRGRFPSAPRTAFMLGCLRELDGALRERGGRLVVRHGKPEREIPRLAEEVGARSVHWTGDVSPWARARDQAVIDALAARRILAHASAGRLRGGRPGAHPHEAGQALHGVLAVRARLGQGDRGATRCTAPRELRLPSGLRAGRLPTLADLGLRPRRRAAPSCPARRPGAARCSASCARAWRTTSSAATPRRAARRACRPTCAGAACRRSSWTRRSPRGPARARAPTATSWPGATSTPPC